MPELDMRLHYFIRQNQENDHLYKISFVIFRMRAWGVGTGSQEKTKHFIYGCYTNIYMEIKKNLESNIHRH